MRTLYVFLFLSLLMACRSRDGIEKTIDPVHRTGTAEENLRGTQPPDIIVEQDQGGTIADISDAPSLNPVFFAYDRYDLTPDQVAVIRKNADVLRNTLSPVLIEGHCDERGTEEYNLALGDRRARVVKENLIQLGIKPDHLRTVTYGEQNPFVDGHDENAWSQNRRAHFVQQK